MWPFCKQQDACTGVHSACRREEMCTTPSTAQAGADAGICWSYLRGGGLDLKIWDLNRAHETETTVFPMPQVFSMCRRRLRDKRKHKRYSTNSAMNTL